MPRTNITSAEVTSLVETMSKAARPVAVAGTVSGALAVLFCIVYALDGSYHWALRILAGLAALIWFRLTINAAIVSATLSWILKTARERSARP